jgi:hypothetical protein
LSFGLASSSLPRTFQSATMFRGMDCLLSSCREGSASILGAKVTCRLTDGLGVVKGVFDEERAHGDICDSMPRLELVLWIGGDKDRFEHDLEG